MVTRYQRILAVIGLILICASIVLMLAGFYAGNARELLLSIALFCFLGAVTILLGVRARREKESGGDRGEAG